MGTVSSQITSLTIVYTTVYSDADQSKHQISASLAFVWGIHRGSVNSPHKWPVTRKMFPFDDVIMYESTLIPAWVSNYSHHNVWDELTYPFPNLNCAAVKDWAWISHCPARRTTLIATRFRVAVICLISQVPHCIRVFFYFVWFVFINHIFQFYNELCTYCNILDIYLS